MGMAHLLSLLRPQTTMTPRAPPIPTRQGTSDDALPPPFRGLPLAAGPAAARPMEYLVADVVGAPDPVEVEVDEMDPQETPLFPKPINRPVNIEQVSVVMVT